MFVCCSLAVPLMPADVALSLTHATRCQRVLGEVRQTCGHVASGAYHVGGVLVHLSQPPMAMGTAALPHCRRPWPWEPPHSRCPTRIQPLEPALQAASRFHGSAWHQTLTCTVYWPSRIGDWAMGVNTRPNVVHAWRPCTCMQFWDSANLNCTAPSSRSHHTTPRISVHQQQLQHGIFVLCLEYWAYCAM